MKNLIIFTLVLSSFTSFAANSKRAVDNAFEITHTLSKMTIKTPSYKTDDLSVMLTNNTLSNIYAKITTDTRNIKFFRLDSKSQKVIDIEIKKGEKYYYVPLAPSLYQIEIAFGKGQYEIPGKK